MPDSPLSNSPIPTECLRSLSWNRSVKRKFDSPPSSSPSSPVSVHRHRHHQLRNVSSPPSADVLARVEIENERYALRETLSRQQMTINQLYVELDEERNAAASAAEEAMSMILRLQREKAEVEMDGRQFKRFVEERIAHDQNEIRALEDVHYRHDQAMQALSFEVQAYRHRLLSYGIDPDDGAPRRRYELEGDLEEEEDLRSPELPNDADIQNDINGSVVAIALDNDDVGVVDDSDRRSFDTPLFDYPSLRCTTCNDDFNQSDKSVVVREHLQNIDQRTHQIEKPSSIRDNATSSTLLARDVMHDQVTSNNGKDSGDVKFRQHVGNEDDENHNTNDDRVYTVDTDYGATQLSNEVGENTKKADVKNLYRRLQILEADRESLKKAIISSRSDKVQLSLLKEIAQNLANKNGAARSDVYVAERMVAKRSLSFFSLFKVRYIDLFEILNVVLKNTTISSFFW